MSFARSSSTFESVFVWEHHSRIHGSRETEVLIVQLGDPIQLSLFDDIYSDLQKKRAPEYDIIKATTTAAVIDRVSQSDQRLRSILVVDGGLSMQTLHTIHTQLATYARTGGAVIFCCNFSSFVNSPDFAALARNMGLAWQFGDYKREDFSLNPAAKKLIGFAAYKTLEKWYSMKAVHLKNVDVGAKIYIDVPTSKAGQAQCPTVLQAHEWGFIAYIGDVDNETGSQTLLMSMLEFTATRAPTDGIVNTEPKSVNGKGGCAVCGDKTPVRKCVGCNEVQYCSKACLRMDGQCTSQRVSPLEFGMVETSSWFFSGRLTADWKQTCIRSLDRNAC